MLIRIDRSIVETEIYPHSWSNETITALENLALARREGKHLIIADRETLEKIGQCKDLSKNTIVIYNKILNNVSKYKAYLSTVTLYLEIQKSCLEPSLKNINSLSIIQVPLKFFQDSEQIQKTILLCENAIDANFYEILTRVFILWKRRKVSLSFEVRGGGGTTVKTEYDNILNEQKRFCLCLLDSDRSSPNDSLGETAKQTLEKYNSLDPRCIRTQVFVLDVREIENLIPLSILSQICEDIQRQQALKLLETIQNCSAKDIRDVLDMKEGLKFKKIIDKSSLIVREFWQDKITELQNLKIIDIHPKCKTWECNNKNEEEICTCQIAYGFGNKILENSLTCMETKNFHEIGKTIEEPLRSHWEKIGQAIVNWCVAGDRIIS